MAEVTREQALVNLGIIREEMYDEEYGEQTQDSIEFQESLDMAISALKSGWIPVEERKPEEAYPCYVTVEEDDIYGEPYSEIYPEFVGYDGETWNNSDGEPIPLEVIAWQRKPEPYKKGE